MLDVNLGGERIDSLADLLMAQRVPMVFVTGYGASEVDRRFAAPVLQKPFDECQLVQAIERAGYRVPATTT